MRGLTLLCLLLFIGAPATAATFDRDDRVALTQPDLRFLPIGVVRGGKRVAHATGFLVSDCHVLTVKHAAGRVANVVGRRMRFDLPFSGPAGESAGSVVAAGGLDLVGDPNRLDRSEDWLLVRLDRCLGRRFGTLALAGSANRPAPIRTSGPTALFSAGFPIDQSWRRQLTVDPACRLRGEPQRLFVHDCSSLPGNSGSPIFTTVRRDGRAVVEVLAMHSTASADRRVLAFRGEDGSIATRMTDVLPAIRAYLPSPVAQPALAPTRLASAEPR